ncbi:related to DNA replication regulator SLD2 [Phialocephala subalpina]|uniref:DNA replication regulator SLD2 n=1 Tax=Phialocephala subalpina TaxID=576137 RepID=A0A1L7WXM6_9HELO|nr:related to DNA replication regulator SLD2 [Phialocephala subalpina]
MEESRRAELTERSDTLRVELKSWEKDFAAANNGKKASRDAIKQNPEIAAKYKEYNKVRDILSGKIVEKAPEPKRQTPRKRKHEDEAGHETSKRLQLAKTPSKTPSNTHVQPWEVDPYDSPSVIRNLFTPSKKTVLGPTPQKDGQVLGLFDLLQEEGVEASPSGGESTLKVPIQGTPRKATAGTPHKHSRTPGGRKKLLDAFATPLKNRDMNGQGGKTPSSVSKLHFSTPSFLRRDNYRIQMPVVHENEDGITLSPEMVRIPRKPLVRGLSSMLAGLRKMQDDAADDDLDALREMEMEEAAEPIPKPKPKPKTIPEEPPQDILVEDSQPGFPLGGFDDEAQFDSEPEAAEEPRLGRDGKPMKVYKKKGQKRTTRRVKIKPTRSKPATKPKDTPEESEDELAGSGPDEAVPETQMDNTPFAEPAANFDSDTQSEYTASEGGTRYRRPNQTTNRQANKDGKIKTAARKVGAMAHQNFKRLKLRNSGAKGGPAHNSRFRRKK